ncbi:CapA family protein [Geofilum rubicundum]|uniref:Capsule biosynthesis protein CapA n=1 Tax=Geofilum rubicundum JCM 15548 TaxID=1236989 RepID=A0A0E9LRG1_9BACT|nr:CapA family protein [Geofilum rubicundum]GAO28177.1 capsule biosynthesis protein CapA [Geofilum rubicundum JCM 15548]
MRTVLLIFILFAGSGHLRPQDVSLLFFGDIMGHGAQIESARQADDSYDYSSCFRYIEPTFRSAHIVTGNLEVTLAGPPYAGYPAFTSPDELGQALKEAGVNTLVTANNHSYDKGRRGMERTIDILEELYFVRTGTFKDSADFHLHNPKLIHIEGIRLALLNYTYGTNGIRVQQPNLVNHINKSEITEHIHKAQALNPDKIIVFIHWGKEYQTVPDLMQQETAAFLFDQGADIIIGSHPHVVQPMHLTVNAEGKEQLVVYSLGNFVSNQRKAYTDGGAMVRIELSKAADTTRITKAEHMLTWVHTPIEAGKKKYYILPASIYSQQGVPDFVPHGWEGMNSYLLKAREVMKNNTNIPEAREEWPLL